MKPDYAKFKPPFEYSPIDDYVSDANGVAICDMRLIVARNPLSRQDASQFGHRIAELLNKDAEEKEEGLKR